MSAASDSALSLIERKKLQWAREKEELATLSTPWGISEDNCRPFDRNPRQPKRRSSLPPLYKNQYNSYDKYDREKEVGGETSGYGSDNPNQSPDYVQTWHQSGYESSSSRDDRLKWGDKGVGVGKFWHPKEESLEESPMGDPPNWVKRGLKNGEIIVNNTSPAESPEQRYAEDRPQTGSSYSQSRSTFLRGQNIYIDSLELAERERRRQAALAHQDAIRQQLEDREKRRQEERERRIKEEYEEELRIEREQELERQRKEQELKLLQEKQERERKRKQVIEEAIVLAKKEAELVKTRKNKHNANINSLSNLETKIILSNKEDNVEQLTEISDKKTNCDQLNNTRQVLSRAESLSNDFNNNLEIRGTGITSPRVSKDENKDKAISTNNTKSPINQNVYSSPSVITTPRVDNNLALLFPTSLENLQNVHYAVLIPATPQALPISVPISIPQLQLHNSNNSRTENRVLTPTQLRDTNKSFCDSSTQTEESTFTQRESPCDSQDKSVRERLTNLDMCYESRNRKERRSRSESLEERPKWGVNRPPTRYVKQSEKDPLYQRRKLRQKLREVKSYDDKNSSDESQTASPRSYRKKEGGDKRHSRSHWRKDEFFTRNIRLCQTEIIPLETDKRHIYYKKNDCCCMCRCKRHVCSGSNLNVDILKIDHSPRNNSVYEDSIERSEKLPRLDANSDMLEKLSSLHNGLLIKQDEWDQIPIESPVPTNSWN